MDLQIEDVDRIFDSFFAGDASVGLVWGVIADGQLVHSGARGSTALVDGHPPTLDTSFRIASMTKSFTAATVLALRDEGRLQLDDPAERYVPELSAARPPWSDARPVTIRQLLTMTAGLPTDDPWGDRMTSASIVDFRSSLLAGLTYNRRPGTGWEYANINYALLGLIITAAAGADYGRVVSERILAPLGLAGTAFEPDGLVDVASGHHPTPRGLASEPWAGYGAFAPMGGLLSTVRDLASWVAWHLDASGQSPTPTALAPASRREMGAAHVPTDPPPVPRPFGSPASTSGYGFGLATHDNPVHGLTVGHGGGYPGFGSRMQWHPEAGVGVVAVANRTYAPLFVPTLSALHQLVGSGRRRSATASAALIAARDAALGVLVGGQPIAELSPLAVNVALDRSLADRQADIDRAIARVGALGWDGSWTVHTPSEAVMWLDGVDGRVKVLLQLTPQARPEIQTLDVTVVPTPPESLARIARAIAAAATGPQAGLPDGLDVLDPETTARQIAALGALAGPVILGHSIEGDGLTRATWQLTGRRPARLTVVHGDDGVRVTVTEIAE